MSSHLNVPLVYLFQFQYDSTSLCFSLFLTVTADHEHCRVLQKYVEVTRKQERTNIEISHSYYRQHTISLIKAWPPCMITSPLLTCTCHAQNLRNSRLPDNILCVLF